MPAGIPQETTSKWVAKALGEMSGGWMVEIAERVGYEGDKDKWSSKKRSPRKP